MEKKGVPDIIGIFSANVSQENNNAYVCYSDLLLVERFVLVMKKGF